MGNKDSVISELISSNFVDTSASLFIASRIVHYSKKPNEYDSRSWKFPWQFFFQNWAITKCVWKQFILHEIDDTDIHTYQGYFHSPVQ